MRIFHCQFGTEKPRVALLRNAAEGADIGKELSNTGRFITTVSPGGRLSFDVSQSGEAIALLWYSGCWRSFGQPNMEPERVDTDYRVEVSGWDVAESFFVEKVTIELTDAGERVVHLKHPLREGLIVFLRLIESRINFPTLPVAYRVMEVGPSQKDGVIRVSLKKLRQHQIDESEPPVSGRVELL